MEPGPSSVAMLARAAAILLVFPFRLVIFLGLIWFFGGNRTSGMLLIAGGAAGYWTTVLALRAGRGRRPRNEDSLSRWRDEVRADRPSLSVSEIGIHRVRTRGGSVFTRPETKHRDLP